jgi:hypothetical protein
LDEAGSPDVTDHELNDREYQIIRETDRWLLFDRKKPAMRDAICWGINVGALYPVEPVSAADTEGSA